VPGASTGPTPQQLRLQEENRQWEKKAAAAVGKLRLPSFAVTKAIHITDPCYDRGTWCAQWDVAAKAGKWVASAVLGDLPGWGERVTNIVVRHESFDPNGQQDWEFLGNVGVDSGQAGVFAAEAYPEGDETGDMRDLESFYGKCCALTIAEPRYGTFAGGFVTSSGLGDGSYPVEVVRIAGKVVAVRIDFAAHPLLDD
jgi:hypothetical protein